MTAPALPFTPALATRLSGRPFLLLLDVDGTLSPIAPSPEVAVVPPETRRVVESLADLPGVHVALLSGRAAADTARMVSARGVWTIGNHGFEMAAPGESASAIDEVRPFARAVEGALSRLKKVTADYRGVFVEDKHWTLSVHYRSADRSVIGELIEKVGAIARDCGLRVTRGKAVIEVRPPIPVDKGTAALALAQQLGAVNDAASIFCAGDDRTDEDAFIALRALQAQDVTVRVTADDDDDLIETAAEFSVRDTTELRELLEVILELRREVAS